MKRLLSIFLFAALTFTMSCSQTNTTDKVDIDAQGALIKFEKIVHNFDTIENKGNGTYEFVFINQGTEPLVLSNVSSSCGCTIPSWPREPIASGKESGIKVKYDTRRPGSFSKSITVYSNGSETPIRLSIKGTVKPPEAAKAAETTVN